MAKFFINRPIVAMVISILMVIVGSRRHGPATHRAVSEHRPARDPVTATYPGPTR